MRHAWWTRTHHFNDIIGLIGPTTPFSSKCHVRLQSGSSKGTAGKRAASQKNAVRSRVGDLHGRYERLPIFIDDLNATLEAHRSSNRVGGIRKVVSKKMEEHYKIASSSEAQTSEHPGTISIFNPQKAATVSKQSIRSAALKNSNTTETYTDARRFSARSNLDYKGRPQRCEKDWSTEGVPSASTICPWLSLIQSPSEEPSDRLSSEIQAFESYMRLTSGEEAARKFAYADIIDTFGPGYQMQVVGSHSNGLACPTSDLDISVSHELQDWNSLVMSHVGSGSSTKQELLTVLRLARSRLQKRPDIFSSLRLIQARVPIVEARHLATGLEIQLQGPVRYDIQTDLVKDYLCEYPALRALYIAVRHSLEIRGLTKASTGGLGSYPLLIMIVTALKHMKSRHTVDSTEKHGDSHAFVGEQLLHVLYFWSRRSIYDQAFTADPFQIIKKRANDDVISAKLESSDDGDPQKIGLDSIMQELDPRRPYLLCLQDPADFSNNLGRHAIKIKDIQAAFRSALIDIKRELSSKVWSSHGLQNRRSFLYPLLAANYEPFEAHRRWTEASTAPPISYEGDDPPNLEEVGGTKSNRYPPGDVAHTTSSG